MLIMINSLKLKFLVFTVVLCQSEANPNLKAFKIFDNDNEITLRTAQLKLDITYPGTLWCGPGDVASSDDQLGYHKETDKCCRDHDHCDHLEPGESNNYLVNNDIFSVMNCECDREFKKCLKANKSFVSNKIGIIYFTARSRCYMEEYPIIKCKTYDHRLFVKRCVEYILDTSKPKAYQWFDLPFYSSDYYV